MNDNWTLISEISSTELMKNSFRSIAIYIFIFLFVWLILIVFLRLFIRRIVQPINQLSIAAEKVGQGSFDMSVDIHTNDEIEELADTFNKMVIDINTLMKDSVEHEKKIQNMKTENLMLQINPHFIYNTMNSIVYMARMKGNPEIADYTNAFISLLQSTLSVRDSIFNTVKNELATVENYLYLQEYRYRNKFTYHITCDPALLDCQILNVMLQPSVENAIFHGIAPKEGEGKIDITIMKQDSLLHIEIEDNGVGMSAETLESILDASSLPSGGIHKIGIGNVKQRIHEVYGDDPFGLWIESSLGEGTKVRMTIPYKI
jgi:two-component system sensor histidine kinase YesM